MSGGTALGSPGAERQRGGAPRTRRSGRTATPAVGSDPHRETAGRGHRRHSRRDGDPRTRGGRPTRPPGPRRGRTGSGSRCHSPFSGTPHVLRRRSQALAPEAPDKAGAPPPSLGADGVSGSGLPADDLGGCPPPERQRIWWPATAFAASDKAPNCRSEAMESRVDTAELPVAPVRPQGRAAGASDQASTLWTTGTPTVPDTAPADPLESRAAAPRSSSPTSTPPDWWSTRPMSVPNGGPPARGPGSSEQRSRSAGPSSASSSCWPPS